MRQAFASVVALVCLALALPVSAATLDSLRQDIQSVLSRSGLGTAGVRIVSLKTGEVIFERNSSLPMVPASNMKLVTSAAALALLEPSFTFRTVAFASAPVVDGHLNGDLYLKGYGDPDLTGDRLAEMARELSARGLKYVAGDLVLDDSFFDHQQKGKGWKPSWDAFSFGARISALSVGYNTLRVWVRPTETGKAAGIQLEPDGDFYRISNQVKTVDGARSRLKVFFSSQGLVVQGSVGAATRGDFAEINLDNPTFYTGGVFRKALAQEGVTFGGSLRGGLTPPDASALAVSFSRPLTVIVKDLNKYSVNFIAEQLLKFLGATFRGEPGTAAKGVQVIKEDFLTGKVGASTQGMVMADGSGLSPLNRISPKLFSGILSYMYRSYQYRPEFEASLATAGVDGTLRERMRHTPAEGLLRAKTGFINGVSSLSGYTVTRDSEPIAFSLLINGYKNLWTAREVQDKISILLTTFTRE